LSRGRRPRHGSTLAGILLTSTGAIGFASKGIFAKALYADGWGALDLVTTRALLALPVIAAWALWAVGLRGVLRAPPRAMLGAALAGVGCYYLGALWDFQALQWIDASVERVLLFSYPSMVVVFHAVLYRERPAGAVLAALALTYGGILMVVTGLDAAVLRGNLAGAGLVLACALTSALYYLAGDRWTPALGSVAFTFYALAAATVCLVVHRALGHAPTTAAWGPRDLALIAGIVVCATVIPMLAMAEGVRRLGAPRASLVSTIGPPTTILLGAWLFGERLHAAQWCGVGLIVAGILTLEGTRPPAAEAATTTGP
jgi:drug/metabolite transporter (DMT)-like permease